MAAAVLGRTEVNVKDAGYGGVIVPDSPIAKLMYYFDCVCICAEPEQSNDIRRLRNFKNYHLLSEEEEIALLVLCLALSPDKLIGSIFFPTDDCGGSSNKFLELSSVNTRMIVSESIIIGGQRRKVRKIMLLERDWIDASYIEPLRALENRSRQSSSTPTRPAITRGPSAPSRITPTPPVSRAPPPPPPSPPRRQERSCIIS